MHMAQFLASKFKVSAARFPALSRLKAVMSENGKKLFFCLNLVICERLSKVIALDC